jgi:hypothetical protein
MANRRSDCNVLSGACTASNMAMVAKDRQHRGGGTQCHGMAACSVRLRALFRNIRANARGCFMFTYRGPSNRIRVTNPVYYCTSLLKKLRMLRVVTKRREPFA